MNETLIEQLQADACALDIKITTQEIALYLSQKKVPPEHLHMAHPNGRLCGAKRPKCEAERSSPL